MTYQLHRGTNNCYKKVVAAFSGMTRELSVASRTRRTITTLTVLPLLALAEARQEALNMKTLKDYYFVTENKQKQ
jgi:hypothetical protein